MARRHWLDPLARRLLIASGQIKPPPAIPPGFAAGLGSGIVSVHGGDLGAARASARGNGGAGADPLLPADHREQVERDLLALKLTQNPGLRLQDGEEVRHAAALGWSLDVNRATAADWARLPGCTAAQVDLLVRLQAGGVQLSGPDDLREVLQLEEATLRCWQPLLAFRWYGAGSPAAAPVAVAVNQAAAPQLARLPGLSAERLSRLLRERARAPFRDLADLGERLVLPPAVLEQWIGRVSFQPGPAGPDLPSPSPTLPSPSQTRPSRSLDSPPSAGPSLPSGRPQA